MKTWSFFDPLTGALSPRRLTSSDPDAIRYNTPAGLHPIEGAYDHLSQRVEITDGVPRVVEWRPPQPSQDHEWDAKTKRWRLSAAAAEREARRAQALARIRALEALQHRALREAVLGIAPSEEDRARGAMTLAEIDQEIAALRPLLSEQTAASGNL